MVNSISTSLAALNAKVKADMQAAAQQIKAATDYIHSLPPLPSVSSSSQHDGNVVTATAISKALNTPPQPSFVPAPSPLSGLAALNAQVHASLQSAAAQIKAATDYIHSLPPLPSISVPLQPHSAPTSGSISLSDMQVAINHLHGLGVLHTK